MELLEAAGAALRLVGCDSVEIGLSRVDEALTRFADSRIHQNVARVHGEARVRVVLDGNRAGVATTSILDPDAVRRTAEQAREIAAAAPPDPTYPGPAPGGQTYDTSAGYDEQTAHCSPQERAGLVAAMLAELPPGVSGAGYVQTTTAEHAFASSTGIAVTHTGTYAAADLLAAEPGSTGHSEAAGSRLAMIDPALIGGRAGRSVELGRQPRDVEPGSWTVVLGPVATAMVVQDLAFMAFSGKDFLDGSSPLTGRLGEQVCAAGVSIVDDPFAVVLPARAFDPEGTPTRRVTLIEDGVARAVAHDRRTGQEAGTGSTGHALAPPNSWGPHPQNLLMEPGAVSTDELIAGCERGLYVNRLHYTNVVSPRHSIMTGMTRNGTFLIEDGRLVGAVRDLRFTQSLLAALSTVDGVGQETGVMTDAFSGSTSAPALRLREFTFTSGTS